MAHSPDISWRALFDELESNNVRDLDGAEAVVVVPVSDRLLTRLAQGRLSGQARIRSVDVRAIGDDRMAVYVRLKQPSFLPPFAIRLRIERQPELPDHPVLVLQLLSQGVAAFAGSAARLFDLFPAEVTLDGDLILVRLDQLLPTDTARDVFERLTMVEVHVIPDRFVLTVRALLSDTGQSG